MYTKEDLTDQSALMELLGYTDERSFVKWCKKNNIPVIKIGLRKYILSHLLTQVIDNQLIIFERGKQSQDINSVPASKKQETKTKPGSEGSYQPKNEIIQKYLSKYESNSKPKTT